MPVRERKGVSTFRYRVGDPADYVFTVDIYGYRDHAHPHRHVGWWRFELPAGRGDAQIYLDFDPVRQESVTISANGETLTRVDSRHNPDCCFDPQGDLELAFRDPEGEIQRRETTLLKFFDRDIIRGFYDRQYASEGYTPLDDQPFLWLLHDYKKGRLRRLFEKHIPSGGLALDVGCGRSLFSEIDADFAFKVVPGDLEYVGVRTRAGEVPEQLWAVFDADRLPFADQQFDALFAGEIIEHMSDVGVTLTEWRRVLKPGGVVIVTTPNRERLPAVADCRERPYSEDHLSELSYREALGTAAARRRPDVRRAVVPVSGSLADRSVVKRPDRRPSTDPREPPGECVADEAALCVGAVPAVALTRPGRRRAEKVTGWHG